jgi:hypothetical protein
MDTALESPLTESELPDLLGPAGMPAAHRYITVCTASRAFTASQAMLA